MSIDTQLIGLLNEMGQEQKMFLLDLLSKKKSEINDEPLSSSCIKEINENKPHIMLCMLRLMFECHENNVNPSAVYESLCPFFLLIDQPA